MSAISLRRHLRRHRHQLVLALALGLLAVAVLAAHGGARADHMGHDEAMSTPAAVCLAIAGTAAVAATAIVVGGLVPFRFPTQRCLSAPSAAWPPAVEPRSRAGPSLLQVFRT